MSEAAPYLPADMPGACWRRSERRLRATTPRRHHEIVALHTLSGSMRYLIDDRIISVGPRTLLWAFSDQSHMLVSETADFDMWVFVIAQKTLSPSTLCPPTMASVRDARSGAFVLSPEQHDELVHIANGVRQRPDHEWREAGLRWWVVRAWSTCGPSNKAEGFQTHPAVQRAVEMLQDSPEVPLETVAQRAHLSLSHLNRLFHREVGQPLGRYRTQCRLTKIDKLVAATPSIDLLNASLDAGFGSYSQFYRCFQSERGMAPRSFYSRHKSQSATDTD
ncbi:MAG: AraC family transcriptional regulator [Pseudomonadota bacterium]